MTVDILHCKGSQNYKLRIITGINIITSVLLLLFNINY